MWCDIEPCLAKLNNEKYSRLNDEIDAIDENGVVDIEEVYLSIYFPRQFYNQLLRFYHKSVCSCIFA